MGQKITPNLWFDGNAKEAVDFYTSVFPTSKVLNTAYYPKTTEDGLADFQVEREVWLATRQDRQPGKGERCAQHIRLKQVGAVATRGAAGDARFEPVRHGACCASALR